MKRRGVHVSPRPRFGHGVVVHLGGGLPVVLGSYHPSRQNTNTGKLTRRMMNDIFRTARVLAG
jgi:uracil-DNA glycosylase